MIKSRTATAAVRGMIGGASSLHVCHVRSPPDELIDPSGRRHLGLRQRSAQARPAPAEPVVAQGRTEWDRINLERNLRWILAREPAGRPSNPRVGVFADAGVWRDGARSIVEALEGAGVPCRVLDRSMLEPKVLG